MNSLGGVGGPAGPDSSLPVSQDSSPKTVNGNHSQFGAVASSPADQSFLEEMAAAVSSTRPTKKKPEEKKKSTLNEQLERIKETMPDMPDKGKTSQFLQQLKNASKNGELTEDQIKQFADEYSGDPSHQYLAMEALIKELREEGDVNLADKLLGYNSDFYTGNKKDIQSGINVSKAAAEYAESSGFGSTQQLRDIWRKGLDVPDFTHPLEAYQFAKEKCGYQDIDKGITWLREALAVELKSLTQSVDSTQLNHIRSRLEVMYGLQTTVENSRNNELMVAKMVAANA